MTMISYAQNGEDVLIRRVFGSKPQGFYVDVGANDPIISSVTKHFYEGGWSGLNLEPSPILFAKLQQDRKRDQNLNLAVSRQSGTQTFYEATQHNGLSTLEAEIAQKYKNEGIPITERLVPVRPLSELFEEYVGDRQIDFMNVDVEGHEKEVLESADFAKWRPVLVVVESTYPRTTQEMSDEWEHLLTGADYVFATFDGLNRYYIRSESIELAERLKIPVNSFDDFIPYRFWIQIHDLKKSQKGRLMAELRHLSRSIKRMWRGRTKPKPSKGSRQDLFTFNAAAEAIRSSSLWVADVGARAGVDQSWYHFPPLTEVIGFEPDAEECARLNASAGHSESFVPIALAKEAGQRKLYLTKEPGCSSLYPPNVELASAYPMLSKVIEPVGETHVTVESLDRWIEQAGRSSPCFMKLDVQGAELEVLQGAEESLARCVGLEVEVEFMPIYKGQPLFSEIELYLRQQGFVLWRLDHRVHYGSQGEEQPPSMPRTDVSVYDKEVELHKAHEGRISWAHALFLRPPQSLPADSESDLQLLLYLAVLLEAAGEFAASRTALARVLDQATSSISDIVAALRTADSQLAGRRIAN